MYKQRSQPLLTHLHLKREQMIKHSVTLQGGAASQALCLHVITHSHGQTYSCMLWQSSSWSWYNSVCVTLHLHAFFFLWSEVACRWCMMLTWFIFSVPLSLPSSSLYFPVQNQPSVLQYRDKLFTHSNQKPANKERIQHQGIVKLSLSPTSPLTVSLSTLTYILQDSSLFPPANVHKRSLTKSQLHIAALQTP